MLLETAPGVMPDSLVSACNQLDGVQVLWVSRYAAGGNLFLDLEAVETLTQNPRHGLRRARRPAADHLPRRLGHCGCAAPATGSRWCTAPRPPPSSTVGHPDWFPAGRAARLALPARLGARPTTARWWPGAPIGDEDDLVLFGRRGGPEVLDSELARLGHLAALAASIAKAV